jgi:hypothetical protein
MRRLLLLCLATKVRTLLWASLEDQREKQSELMHPITTIIITSIVAEQVDSERSLLIKLSTLGRQLARALVEVSFQELEHPLDLLRLHLQGVMNEVRIFPLQLLLQAWSQS